MRTLALGYLWIDTATPLGQLDTDGWRILLVPPLLILTFPVALIAGLLIRLRS